MKQKRNRRILRDVDDNIRKEIIDLYNSGLTIFKIYKFLRVSRENIREILIQEGIEIKKRVVSNIDNKEIQKQLIEKYIDGYSIITLHKKFHITPKTISNFLKKVGVYRNRYNSEEDYIDFWFEDGKWKGIRKCPECSSNIIHSVSGERYLILRNIRNAISEERSCVKCMGKRQTGENNNFYGRTHIKDTLDKMSQNRKGKACGKDNAMAKKENRDKVSKALQEMFDNGDLDHVREINSKLMKEKQRKGLVKTYSPSLAERKIYNELIFLMKKM